MIKIMRTTHDFLRILFVFLILFSSLLYSHQGETKKVTPIETNI